MTKHVVNQVARDGWAPGYGDTTMTVKETWVECTCGWERRVYADYQTKNIEISLFRLNHLVEVICDELSIEI